GGGPVGSLVAIFLAQRGFKVALHERRPDMRRVDISPHPHPSPSGRGVGGEGRSINLAVTSRGLKALAKVGLKEHVLAIAIPMKGRMLHDTEERTTFVPYGQKESEVIHSVSRGSLNQLLLEKAGSYPNVEIAFQQRCVAYDHVASTLTFINDETGRRETVS